MSSVYTPEPISLPTVEAPPIQISEPPQFQQAQQQAAQAPARPSGFTGKGGQVANVVDNFLRGMMAAKQVKEKQASDSRANEIKAHTITAGSMREAAQQAADEARRLQNAGAKPEELAAAQKKAADLHEAYTQEWGQLADAYGRHLGVAGTEKPKGIGGKIKRGAQEMLLPQMAAALAPNAIEAMKKAPPPLRQPSEHETLALDNERKRGKLTDVQINAASLAQKDDEEHRQLVGIPVDKLTPDQKQRLDFHNRIKGLPSLEVQAAQQATAIDTMDKLKFDKGMRDVVTDALSASRQGKALNEIQRGALKAAGMYQSKDVLDYYTEDVGPGHKYKNPMEAIRSFQRDQAQFSRAPSMFQEFVSAEKQIEKLSNGGKLTPDGERSALDRAIRAFRPQGDTNDIRKEYYRTDWIQRRSKEIAAEWKTQNRQIDEKYRKNPEQFEQDALAAATKEREMMDRNSPQAGGPSRISTPGAPALNFKSAADALKAFGIPQQ